MYILIYIHIHIYIYIHSRIHSRIEEICHCAKLQGSVMKRSSHVRGAANEFSIKGWRENLEIQLGDRSLSAAVCHLVGDPFAVPFQFREIFVENLSRA